MLDRLADWYVAWSDKHPVLGITSLVAALWLTAFIFITLSNWIR